MRKLNRLQSVMLLIIAILFLAFVTTSCIATFSRGLLSRNIPIAIGSLMIPFVFALKAQVKEEA
jgi:hypothetical protein